MATLKSLLSLLPGAILFLHAVDAHPSVSSRCHPQANFTLVADAPGTVINGLAVAANIYDAYLSISPNNAAEAKEDNFAPVTFFKNETKSQLYMYFEGYKQRVISPIDGNVQGSIDPGANGFPYYDGKFGTEIDTWPPSGYITFHPGQLINPGQFGQSPPSKGGFFACYDNSFNDYYVWVGTYAFQTSTFDPNPSFCIAFKPKIQITGVGLSCAI